MKRKNGETMRQAGTSAAFELVERMFAEHAKTVYRYCRLRLETQDAHDAVSEVFVVALRRVDNIPSAQVAWLLGVARRVVANQLRAKRRAGALASKLAAGLGRGTDVPDVAESVLARDLAYRALAGLRPGDREVLLLALAAPMTEAELALALGCSKKAASVRLSRARARLNQAVAQGGLGDSSSAPAASDQVPCPMSGPMPGPVSEPIPTQVSGPLPAQVSGPLPASPGQLLVEEP
ncbi:MAG: sigma-70 family RNA polymerase sigma factor [Bifidobacteriaceae bacterium]|jgi:RNA polymerase sigma-70 factor (ECF subfamily)|nr:sigma-70 family RNA polymerase sigma factor [Bifidobacteriaceae bacterium]